jgi:hemoglobin
MEAASCLQSVRSDDMPEGELNANAAVDEAHHRVSAAGFKYYVTEMVC